MSDPVKCSAAACGKSERLMFLHALCHMSAKLQVVLDTEKNDLLVSCGECGLAVGTFPLATSAVRP